MGATLDALLGRPGVVLDEALLTEIEESLIAADVGVATTAALLAGLRAQVQRREITEAGRVREALKDSIRRILSARPYDLNTAPTPPLAVMVIGVNGVGKTTTIAKLAGFYRGQGKSVVLAAGDTFRAAAIEQLEVWGARLGVPVVKQRPGADPSAVVVDAARRARADGADVLIADTAGRLHTKGNLMEELKKMRRVLAREIPGAPHEVLLVLDATTGQNALAQARTFGAAVDVTGIALAKLDGTAKGGIVIAIAHDLGIPVKVVGVGEKIEDLRLFDPHEYVEALL